jgi:catechol-2,3-dioxygenase
MLKSVSELTYAIVLCEDMELMKAFYHDLLPFPVVTETATSMSLDAGGVLLGLRLRDRDYDGRGGGSASPGVQLAFLVSPAEVDACYQQLVEGGIEILEPPTDQPRGHRTVYFSDPEGNVLEVYAEI